MKLSTSSKRLLIYFFYDDDGVVDSYVTHLLKDMKKSVDSIFFVSNGKLEKNSKEKVAAIADDIYERRNEGFDVWAYKTAIEKIGLKKIGNEYDELILMNYTIMGPLYPFSEMFAEMDNTDVDFWGLTRYHKQPIARPELFGPDGIPNHLQSHFIAIRKKMLTSKEFKKYWADMPEINSYDDSVLLHETKFTRHFANHGFRWTAYVDTEDLEKFTFCPILYAPVELIKNRKCPVFKRRSFMHDMVDTLYNSVGEQGYELMKYLKKHTDYDTDMIWENLLRCYPMEKIKNSLNLNYTLPEIATVSAEHNYKQNKPKVALVFHIYFMDLLDSTYKYVNSMPADADIYLTVSGTEKINLVKKRFKDHKFNKLEVLPIENRGRDVSALLVPTKDFIMDYDCVCFAHDKKTKQIEPESVGAGFAYQCLENTLGTEGFVKNVIDLFEQNPRLGLLTPPPPFHSAFLTTIAQGWGLNYENTEKLAKKLKLKVPMSPKSYPITPLGTMFWFRPKGMKKLFDADWKYTDFPKEPNNNDGTLLHAVERVYGLTVQDAGYYAAWGVSDKFSAILTTNAIFMLSGFVTEVIKGGATIGQYASLIEYMKQQNTYANSYKTVVDSIAQTLGVRSSIDSSKIRGDMKIYFPMDGELSEENTVSFNTDKKTFSHVFKLPKSDSKISYLRFDPEELGNVILSNLSIEMLLQNKETVTVSPDAITANGIYYDGKYVFKNEDPNLCWDIDEDKEVVSVKISATIERDVKESEISALYDAHEKLVIAALAHCQKEQEELSKKIFKLYLNYGDGFSEETAVAAEENAIASGVVLFKIPNKDKPVFSMRFDPGENKNVCLKLKSILVKSDTGELLVDQSSLIPNGLAINDKYVFLQPDPWVMWSLPENTLPEYVLVSFDFTEDVISEISALNDLVNISKNGKRSSKKTTKGKM